MENKRIKKMYDVHITELIKFSEDADYLNEQSRYEYLAFRKKMFKAEIDQEHKREAFVRKGANQLYRQVLKAMKNELKQRAKARKLELAKLALLTKYGQANDVVSVENFANCETCTNCSKNDSGNLCCVAYNLVFRSDELRHSFCACYCTAYETSKETTTETESESDVPENDEATDDTATPPEEEKTPEEATDEEPKCCKECEAFIDADDGCFCTKYGKYVNDCDVDSICCCENDDFFEDEEDDEE